MWTPLPLRLAATWLGRIVTCDSGKILWLSEFFEGDTWVPLSDISDIKDGRCPGVQITERLAGQASYRWRE